LKISALRKRSKILLRLKNGAKVAHFGAQKAIFQDRKTLYVADLEGFLFCSNP